MMNLPEKLLRPIYQSIHKRVTPYLRTWQDLIQLRILLRYALKQLREEKSKAIIVSPLKKRGSIESHLVV